MFRTASHTHTSIKQTQIVLNFSSRANRRTRIMRRSLLVNGNRRRDPRKIIKLRLVSHIKKLTSISRKRLHITPLPLSKDSIKSQRRLTRPRNPSNNHNTVTRQSKINILQIVSTHTTQFNGFSHKFKSKPRRSKIKARKCTKEKETRDKRGSKKKPTPQKTGEGAGEAGVREKWVRVRERGGGCGK